MNNNNNRSLQIKPKYQFEEKPARSKNNLYTYFRTKESEFYKWTFQQKNTGQEDSSSSTFSGTIGSAKNTQLTGFHFCVPLIKYLQYDTNTCCLIILGSVLYDTGYYVTEQAIAEYIQESSVC